MSEVVSLLDEFALAFTKAYPCEALSFAPALQDHGIAVRKEAAGLAVLKRDRLAAVLRQLDHRARLARLRARDRAAAEQVARLEVASAYGVVATIWATVQYWCRKLVRDRRSAGMPSLRCCAVWSQTSSWISSPPESELPGWSR